MLGYAIGIFGLFFLIFIHELGHFLAALYFKMPIKSFALGFGPALLKKEKNGIQYRINWIPLGGYVSLHGENDEKIENGFMNQPIYKRFWVLIAGILFNFTTAYIILVALFSIWGSPHHSVQISHVSEETHAYSFLKKDDIIVRIGNEKVDGEKLGNVSEMISQSNKEVSIEVRRNNENLQFSIPFTNLNGKSVLGIEYGSATLFYKDGNFFKNIVVAPFEETGDLFKTIFTNLKMLFTGEVSIKDMSGPVGIVDTTNNIFHISVPLLFWWFALLSINLGVMNALPIPALDGGQILFLLLEKIIGKNAWNKRIAAIFNAIFFLILLSLMAYITYGDISRLINK